jgi:PAS domain S-box-containing protein
MKKEEQYRRYSFLIQTIQAISSTLALTHILERLDASIKSFFGADGLEFLILSTSEEERSFWREKEVPHLTVISDDKVESIPELKRIVRDQEVMLIKVDERTELSKEVREFFEGMSAITVLGFPITRDEVGVGAGIVCFERERAIGQDDLLLLRVIMNLAGNAILNAILHQRVSEIGERYRTLVEHLGAGVVILQDERIKFANDYMVELSGYTREELYSIPFYQLISPQDRKKALENYRRRLNGENPPETYGFWGMRKDGREIYIEGIYSVIPYGGRRAVVAVIRDATEKLQMEQELERASRLEGLSLLAGGIAHNFNNLLTGIMGNATLIKLGAKPNSQVYKRAEVIETLSQRGAALVNRLLAFAQRIGEEKQVVDVNRVVRENIELFKLDIAQENIQLNFIPAPEPIMIRVAPKALGTAVQSLLENSVEAMPDGGRIDVSLSRESDYAVISVKDTGKGVSREMMGKLFDPFYSTKDPSEGAGLGLAMVYGIANEHGGYVRAESRPGVGSTFNIYLPALQEDEAQEQAESDMILIVEASEIVREMMKTTLVNYGYTAIISENLTDAVELLKELGNRVKVIILDLTIRGLGGGIKVFEMFKNGCPGIKIIGTSSEPEDERVMEHGAAGFLLKPFGMNQFLTLVENAFKMG